MFDDPPGCPEGWQEEELTSEQCDDNCDDPLIETWLVYQANAGFHCCEIHLEGGTPGPNCLYLWQNILGGSSFIDPHNCCNLHNSPSKISDKEKTLDNKTLSEIKRFKKLAGLKK